jgi:hypothetical protein
MTKWIIIGCIILFDLIGLGIYKYSSAKVIDELVMAVHNKDVAAVSARIDWEGLKAQLKEDIAAQKKAYGQAGTAIGPIASRIAPVVEHYIKEDGIKTAFYYREQLFKDVPERDFIDSTGFALPFGFQVTLAYPVSQAAANPMAMAMRDRMKVKVVFGLDGFTWKIREMHVPLYMVPADTGALPDLRMLGK